MAALGQSHLRQGRPPGEVSLLFASGKTEIFVQPVVGSQDAFALRERQSFGTMLRHVECRA